MDLNSYAELAVRLVNTQSGGGEDGDRLTSLDGLRTLVADREHLSSGMTRNDLEALRDLRGEFRAFFAACADGDGEDAAARLNALLISIRCTLSCPGTRASLGTCTTPRAGRWPTSTRPGPRWAWLSG